MLPALCQEPDFAADNAVSRSALASGRSPRAASIRATKAAMLRLCAFASASSTAQNSVSSATLVRWPESEKERFFSTVYFGPIMSLGSTILSNSSEVTRPVLSASSFSVVPFLCAVLAILAAAS